MRIRSILLTAPLLLLPIVLSGQGRGVAPAELLKPLADSWPTYSGDYSGRRFSALKQIDQTTVKHLTLAWVARLTEGPGTGGRGGGRGAAARQSSSAAKARATSRSAAAASRGRR